MAKLFQIEPGDGSVVDDPAAADNEMTQTRGAAGRHRPEQRVVQAEIAGMRELEEGEISKLAGCDDAGVLET